MIMQSLAVAFILAFSATAIFGHLLLVRAIFTPTKGGGAAAADARGWLGRVQPGVGAVGIDGLLGGAGFAEEIISALEARALWSRYGL